jgi:transcriptional regulator with XRE-family HTH domain
MTTTKRDAVTPAVKRALRAAPCSMHDLARTAGLSRQALSIVAADKRRATVRTATKVADALEEWARICGREAKQLRRALAREVAT